MLDEIITEMLKCGFDNDMFGLVFLAMCVAEMYEFDYEKVQLN